MNSRVEDIFHDVVDLSSDARAKYFAERKLDEDLRRQIEALIAFDSTSSQALENAVSQVADAAVSRFDATDTRCGHYWLTALLGRGGMGEVYLGERIDGEIKHRVAVKLLSLGSKNPELRKRFLTERQILASLSQPNIARLLDAGHREDGRPYLVMEYVEGEPVDVFAERLGIRQKLELFLKICAAVGYLHQNLVVHRDLKPNNIFVTKEGEPKILDFGIAKMLGLSSDSDVTSLRILTPDYASPEQVAGKVVTTATDTYSLAAVLYKLLTGVSPHHFETDPSGAVLSIVPLAKITPPSKLEPAIRGDLEMILMMGLRPEPQDRYATVEQFGKDLENYLALRPIRARAGDFWYRTRKFYRRRWVPVTAALLVIISLVSGLYIANQQRIVAERRFEQLRQLSKRVIDLDSAIRTLPGSVGARRRLVAASLEYLEGLSNDARGNLDLAEEIADGYWRMARIQGVNAEFNLGDSAQAEKSLVKAERLIQSVLESRPHDRNALFRSALFAHDHMILADEEQRPDAVGYARKSAETLEDFLRRDDARDRVHLDGFLRAGDPREAERTGAGLLFSNIALMHVNRHLYDDAVRYARRSVDLVKPIPHAQDVASGGLSVLANALRYQGDLENALKTIHQAIESSQSASYPNETARIFNLFGPLFREGLLLGERDAVNLDRPAEAAAVLQGAIAMMDQAAQKDRGDAATRLRLATASRELGDILRDRDPARSLAVFDLALNRLGEIKSSLTVLRDRATLLAKSSYALRNLHRSPEAKQRIDSAFAILRSTKNYPAERIPIGNHAYNVVTALADFEMGAGDRKKALAEYEGLLSGVMAGKPDVWGDLRDAPKLSRIYSSLTTLYTQLGEATKAAAMKTQRVELWRHWDHKLGQNAFVRRQLEEAVHS